MPAPSLGTTLLASRHASELGLLIAGETNVQERDDPRTAFDGVREVFAAADVRFCHLEGLLAPPSDDPSDPDIPHKLRWRHSGPRMVEALTSVRIDAVGCASNVSYPNHAVEASAAVLTEAGIAFAGIGGDRARARAPAIVERRGTRIAFLSYTSVFWPSAHAAEADRAGTAVLRARTAYAPGRRALEMPGAAPDIVTFVEPEELEGLRADVAAARRAADIVIVSCHWGVSSSSEPIEYQRTLGRAAVEAGADAVIGHHPHVLQPIEFHLGRPIFFSIGNFVFDWPKMRGRNLDGLLLRLDVADGGVRRVRVAPVQRDADNQIALLDPACGEGHRIVERLRALSGEGVAFDTGVDGLELSAPG